MWVTCSGSLIPNLLIDKDTSGEDAAYGTVAHGVGEDWLRTGRNQEYRVGEIVNVKRKDGVEYDIEITYEMIDAVQEYVDWCINLPGDHYVEVKVDFSDLTPIENQRGTADHAVCQYQHMIVTDLKMGKGVRVYAKDNTQAILYAYGFFREWDWLYDFQTITIRIAQPRLDHFDIWEISREELLRWADFIKERAHAAWCTDATKTPSEKGCQFCKIMTNCSSYLAFYHKLSEGVFDDLTVTSDELHETIEQLESGELDLRPVDLSGLSLEQKAKILPYRSMVEKWFRRIEEELESAALQGIKVKGYKVVEGRSDRQFKSEQQAVYFMREMGVSESDMYKKSLIGIGAAEELLRKKGIKRKDLPDVMKPIIFKPRGKPTLVPESDKRSEITVSVDDVFTPHDDEL